MIISNPPYIPEKDLGKLDLVVKSEPELALDGGDGGVSIINRVLDGSENILKSSGCIFVEIDSSNIDYIKVPESVNYSINNDQYGRIRVLKGVKI
jgi:release factor glutamine methyltransferase